MKKSICIFLLFGFISGSSCLIAEEKSTNEVRKAEIVDKQAKGHEPDAKLIKVLEENLDKALCAYNDSNWNDFIECLQSSGLGGDSLKNRLKDFGKYLSKKLTKKMFLKAGPMLGYDVKFEKIEKASMEVCFTLEDGKYKITILRFDNEK